MSTAPPLPLTKADFQSDQETRWCPGCGDYSVLAAIQGFMPELGIPPERIVFVTGIGCAGRFAYYMDTYGMHAIHGRAPTIATGLAAARDDLSVWIVSGDGDALSIGANHLVHALRRNVPVKILLFNNRIYGLTKGQASPTSEFGKVDQVDAGRLHRPAARRAVARARRGATFVARTVDRDKQGLVEVLRAAAEHRGAAFVEVLQDCPVFNDGAFDHLTNKDAAAVNRIHLVDGQPIRFGLDHELGVVRDDDGTLGVARVDEVGADRLIVHDATCEDPSLAFALARLGVLGAGPLPLGVFRAVDAPPWGGELVAELRAAREGLGDDDIDALLHAGDTWTIARVSLRQPPALGGVRGVGRDAPPRRARRGEHLLGRQLVGGVGHAGDDLGGAHHVDGRRAHLADDLGQGEVGLLLEGLARMAPRAARAVARLGRALRVVVCGGQAPYRLGELAHRVDQPVGGGEAGARVAQGVAREHARVAYGEVQVGQRARVALEQAAGAAPGWREAHHLARRREGLLEVAHVGVDGARPRQRALGTLGVGLGERRRRRLERLAEVAEDRLGRAPHDQRRVGREEERADGHRHRAAGQRLEEAVGRVARVRRLDRGQQQRRDRRLGDQQLAAAEDDRGAHGEHDHEPDLQWPVADGVDDEVGHREAEHDAGDQLGGAPPALLVARAERDHRCDRGEHRPRVLDRQQRAR